MERKTEKSIQQQEWEAYLYHSVASDKPLDKLFGEMIAADGADEKLRPAAKFILERDAEPNALTRDIGRLAFGMDLQCCQCHDHPLIDDYYQDDYYGLFAFVHRTSLFTDTKTKLISLTEKAEGEASFKSVFTGASSDKALPRLPKGAVLFVEPTFAKGEEYSVKPDKTVRGVPKFSRRAVLAEMVPSSREFARNMANRLWAHMLGRGLVHPVDFHYAGNPPSNPPVLSLLANELSRGGFQLRPLLRELALTRTYSRACDAPRPETVNFADVAARLALLKQQKDQRQKTLGSFSELVAKAKSELKSAREADSKIAAELPKLEKAVADARQALEKAESEQQAARTAAAAAQDQSDALSQIATKISELRDKLPSDKALAEAFGRIMEEAGKLSAAASKAEQSVAAAATRREGAARQLASAESSIKEQTAARPTADQLRHLQESQLVAEHELSEAKYETAAIDARIALAESILSYQSLAKTDAIKADAAWASLVERWTINGQIAPLKPLTPEQMSASSMQAAGFFKAHIASAEAKLDKSPPDALKNASDEDKPRVRAQLMQLELLTQFRSIFSEFARQYGGAPGQDFQATAGQALFFSNGEMLDGWLKQKDGLVGRLVADREKADLSDAAATQRLIDDLYFAVLSRPAAEAEKMQIAKLLRERSDKPAAFYELVWGLLSTTEFRFNH